MAATNLSMIERANAYCRERGISLSKNALGQGKDGGVWSTSRPSALKIHQRIESYHFERDAYIRFKDVNLTEINGFALPELIDFEDRLFAIEMGIVSPPFVVDFASVRLDDPPGLIEDVGNTLDDLIRDRFGDRAGVVISICDQLIGRAGAYLSDLHTHYIKF